MSRVKGRRYDNRPRKLNMKKVIATIIAIIVIIMIIISLKNILTGEEKTKEVASLTTYISVVENGKWGVIDNKGNVIINLDYEEMIVIPNKNEELFIATYDVDYNNETYKTKVLNDEGEVVLANYENIEAIENNDGSNYWYEDNILKFKKDGKYGLIDFDGKIIIEPNYDKIYALQGIENSIVIEKDGKKGLVNNKTGEIVLEAKYIEISSINKNHEDGYIVKNSLNKYGLIANDKTKILEFKYDEIKKIARNNYYVVVENGVVEVINSEGTAILNSGFDSIEGIKVDKFIIIKDGKYGVIDKNGNIVIAPEYENLKFGTSDSYIAQKDGKTGIINKEGNNVINFEYERINYIESADFFEAENLNNTTDIIDRNFNKVLSEVIVSELNIENGYLRIRKDNNYKYYNFKFEEKNAKEIFLNNKMFANKKDGKFGFIDLDGKTVVEHQYDEVTEFNKYGYAGVKKDGLWGVINLKGEIVLEPTYNLDKNSVIDFIGKWYKGIGANYYTDI